MAALAIIGGSGFRSLPDLVVSAERVVETRYGLTSAPLVEGHLGGLPICFLARHGEQHQLPPHRINYRANIQALADAGCTSVVALAAVGGIHADCSPGRLCVPDQLIDYTWGRPQSFFDGEADGVDHIDFSEPFASNLRKALLTAAAAADCPARDGGTHGVTQGPRLETAAEIRRMARDGCDLVGMTAMPEAALARERGLEYATLAFVVNWAAGLGSEALTMEAIEAQIAHCAETIRRVLRALATQQREASGDSRVPIP
jgi:5'-methylthioadenosine phosphorylase/5'-methylthioinosine phosphorylase